MPKPLQTTSALAHRAQSAAAQERKADKPKKVGRKTRAAIDLMVWEGAKRSEAAQRLGMSDNALRQAFQLPHVLAYLNQQMEVLRSSARSHALFRITDLVDSAQSERVKLDAAKYLDGMDRTVHQQGAQVNVGVQVNVETPGYIIDLSEYPSEQGSKAKQIDHLEPHDANALPMQPDVPDDE